MTFLVKVSEIPEGERKLVTVNGVEVAVFHHGGRFYVYALDQRGEALYIEI